MAYNTVVIKKDADNKPVPQYYNPVTDEYEVLQGTNGAARQVLYGPDGNPISVVDNKLAVRAAELEAAISNLQTALLGSQSTAAKQDALAGLVGALDSAAVSDPAAAGAVIALLKGVLSRLQAVERKIDGITDGTTPAKTELTGSFVAESQAVPSRQTAKMEIETIANAISIPPGANSDYIQIPDKSQTEIWIIVNIDQTPWSLFKNQRPWADGGANTRYFYPEYNQCVKAYTLPTVPAKALTICGFTEDYPTNLAEAKAQAFIGPFAVRIDNKNETETATCTVKALRIWR